MICKKCNSNFPIKQVINGKIKNLCNRKYCLECSPFGQHNTKKIDGNSSYCNNICKKHNITKDIKRKNSGSYRCSKCASEAVQRRRDKIKLMSVEYKGGRCQKCSYNKCISALAFHHLDPSTKEFNISRSGHTRSWERVKAELDKCILLCQNCHAETHSASWQ